MANREETSLRSLVVKRGSLKAQITRFSSYVDSVHQDHEVTQLKLRRDKIGATWDTFEDLQAQIELFDEENLVQHVAEREVFENQFFEVMARSETLIQRMIPALQAPSTTSNGNAQGSEREGAAHVKLPTISLPTFNGAYDQWLTFVDTFQSLIHDNPNISQIQKLHYLRSSLRDDAAQVIHSLEISALNYEVAWDLLKERFENKRIIVQSHVKALFELPTMSKESHADLRQLFDSASRHLRALKSLNQPTDSWDPLLIHLITARFDSATKREWESSVDAKEMPKMADMNTFLQNRCHLLQSLESTPAPTKVKPPQQALVQPKQRPFTKGSDAKNPFRQQSYAVSHKSCPKCGQPHLIYQCEEFIKLSVNDRLKDVKRLHLCTNCLRGDHSANQCNSGNCRVCGRKHNTRLHFGTGERDFSRATSHQVATHTSSAETAVPEANEFLGTAALHVASGISSGEIS